MWSFFLCQPDLRCRRCLLTFRMACFLFDAFISVIFLFVIYVCRYMFLAQFFFIDLVWFVENYKSFKMQKSLPHCFRIGGVGLFLELSHFMTIKYDKQIKYILGAFSVFFEGRRRAFIA